MEIEAGNQRRYETLCKVLDSLCDEAPATLNEYHPLKGHYAKQIAARSRGLLHLFLKAQFGLTEFDAREPFITDGPQDGGIDAFYIDNRHKVIHLLQSKFRASSGNFHASNMSAEDLVKMDVKRILNGKKKDEKGKAYNNKIVKELQRSIQKLPDVASYTINVILLGNAKTFTTGQLKKLIEGYAIQQFDHSKIYNDLLFPVVDGTYFTSPDLVIEINIENLKGDTHLDYDVKIGKQQANIKLLFVPTREMGRIMGTYKNSILKFNPRSFLELSRNAVNKDIAASIKNVSSNEFALFNNGITIISDETAVSSNTAKQGTAQVVLHNPQLINGGQTAYVLSRVFEDCNKNGDFKIFKGKEVLLRIITFIGKKSKADSTRLELIGNISKASNSQTKVEESDRRSNDELQIRLQKAFFDKYGLFYERKRGEFSDGVRSDYLDANALIKRERLVRIALAASYRVNLARSNIGQFFEPGEIDDVLSLNEMDKYAYGYDIYKKLEVVRRGGNQKLDRYRTKEFGQALRYGQYAVVAVCVNRCLPKKIDEAKAVTKILSQWTKFEKWIQRQTSNSNYKDEKGAFDFVNYYKGRTIGKDLKAFPFTAQ